MRDKEIDSPMIGDIKRPERQARHVNWALQIEGQKKE